MASMQSIAHEWAHQTRSSRRVGNVSFEGTAFYSYGTVIARLIQNGKGETCAVINSRSYSVSTAKHQGVARGAVRGVHPVFECEGSGYYGQRFDATGPDILTYYQDKAAAILATIRRARSAKGWKVDEGWRLIGSADAAAVFFGLRKLALKDLRAEVASFDPAAWDILQLKRSIANQYKQKQTHAEIIQRWREGKRNTLPRLPYDLLRVIDNRIETSRDVAVSRHEVLPILPRVLRVIESGGTWFTNGEHIRVGHFQLNSICAGLVKIGCHTFQYDEVRQLAEVLK